MGPGPPAAPTRCITPAPPISAALPLLRTSRDGFRAILKPFVPAVPFKFAKFRRRSPPFCPLPPLCETLQNPPRIKSLQIRQICICKCNQQSLSSIYLKLNPLSREWKTFFRKLFSCQGASIFVYRGIHIVISLKMESIDATRILISNTRRNVSTGCG